MKKKDLYDIALDEIHLQEKDNKKKEIRRQKEKMKVRKNPLLMNIRKEF